MDIFPKYFELWPALEGVAGTICAVLVSLLIDSYFRLRGQRIDRGIGHE
jgi:hypothetical protein